MSHFAEDTDSAFCGAGAKPGLEIWCVENLRLVPVPKSSHGRFYSGSAYIVLNTILLKGRPPQNDIHYWLGNDANEVDSAFASDKALELDAALGSCAVQYREVQGLETEKFLSYFKPCIIPIEGVYSSQLGNSNGETYQVSLLTCKGNRVAYVKEVPFSRSSLNHNDVFILDTASKVFLFSGCNSTIQERAKALEVVQYIIENKHGGNCEVATIEDGKFVGDSEVGEFWSLFGGYAPIPRDSPSAVPKQPDAPSVRLFWITAQGKLCQSETGSLNKEMLDTNKSYMLDCNTETFVWMGKNTSVTERKKSISATEDFLRNQGRSIGTHLTFLTEGLETAEFKSYFDNWPQTVEPRLYEEGRGKVAAIFKQQGYDVKELPEENYKPFINCRGTLKVWRVNGDELSLIPVQDQTKLFSGDCYIVQYTYRVNGRDENLFYAWLGRLSVKDDRDDAISHLNAIVDSTKGDPVLAQVIELKEPDQFFLMFQTLIVFKGGMSTRFKNFLAEKGIADETYSEKKTALFRVQGTSPDNMQAIQVDHVSCSLNSSYCYILQTGTSVFAWIGNLSSAREHDLLDRMLELINPTWQSISVREGSEPEIFWNALGGKTEYPREKMLKGHVEDPRLFTNYPDYKMALKTYLTAGHGSFATSSEFPVQVKEIYNFTQDDLTTEDFLVLDCHREIYVWVGCHSNVRSKQQALTLGLKYLETDILDEGLSLETPIYVVTEGHEPPFFTCFFEWDPSKANMHGNSFERKLSILKGKTRSLETPVRNSWTAHSRGTTPDGARRKSLNSNGWGSSVSPASSFSGSKSMSSDNQRFSSPTPSVGKFFSGSSPHQISADKSSKFAGSPEVEHALPNAGPVQINGSKDGANPLIHPYERLKVVSSDPVTGIDVTRREAYLSEEEFQSKFGMTKGAFYELPKWRQNKLKTSLHLF